MTRASSSSPSLYGVTVVLIDNSVSVINNPALRPRRPRAARGFLTGRNGPAITRCRSSCWDEAENVCEEFDISRWERTASGKSRSECTYASQPMFGRKKPGPPPGPAEQTAWNPTFEGLRQQALGAPADWAGFSPAPAGRVVYGAVMDWGLDRGLATVFALEDGTGSLYLSSGGGVIGGQFHESVRQAVRTFIAAFEPFVETMAADAEGEPPPSGFTDLRALTLRGRLVVRAATDEFGSGRHPMSGVFHAGQAVITALRQIPKVGEMRPPSN